MSFYWLTLGVLGVWRITHLLNAEDGPWDLMVRLRGRAGSGVMGTLLDCFNCLSFWVALPMALVLGDDWPERMLLWPAISGAAILLNRLVEKQVAAQPAPFLEDEDDVVLRK